jgi:serine/threonine protein phosphatase 1
MSGRIIAVGDIHGCSTAFAAIIAEIDPKHDDTIVTLGDYVDRGIDSKGVLDQLIDLAGRCRLVPLLGNHEEMLLHARDGRSELQFWLNCGGITTLDSYGDTGRLNLIPSTHIRFLERCVSHFETDSHIFVHANYKHDLPLDQQDGQILRWLSLSDAVPGPHFSGKHAVVGHTPQPEILNIGHLVCLDTGCSVGGCLTAMEMQSGQSWQVDEMGRCRESI